MPNNLWVVTETQWMTEIDLLQFAIEEGSFDVYLMYFKVVLCRKREKQADGCEFGDRHECWI